MDEGLVGLIIFFFIGVATSIICHRAINLYPVASVIAAVVTTVVFHIVTYVYAGYLDAFWLIALFFSSLAALALAFIVGLPFLIYRRRHPHQQQAHRVDQS